MNQVQGPSPSQGGPEHGQSAPNKPVKKPRHRQWGGAILGLLAACGGLVAGRLGHLYPHFDVFSQFGLQFSAMALAFCLAMFFRRFRFLLGVAFTIGLLAAYAAWPHAVSTPLQTGPYKLAAGERLLRVVHFNTFKNNQDYDAIANEVLRLDGDVVTLVEMRQEKMRHVLPKLKARYPHSFDCDGGRRCDMAILSKYPITAGDGLGEWVGPPYVSATLGGDMAGVTIVGVHTIRFPHSRAQLRQVRELVTLLERYSGDIVLAGDFNATPFSRLLGLIEQGAGLSLLTELPTWPTTVQMPQLAIDHVFASKNLRVVADQQIGEAAGSDHYPIIITLAFKP